MAAALEIETLIAAPPAAVFAVATDLARVPEWMTGVEALEPLDEPPLRVGFRFRETRTMKGRRMSAVIEVTEHAGPEQGSPPYRHAAQSSAMGVEGVYAFVFHDAGEGRTRVELRAEVRATSLLAKPLVAMAAKAMKDQDGGMLDALKALCEGEEASA